MNFFSTPNHDSSDNSVDDCGGVELRCEEEEDILILCLGFRSERVVLFMAQSPDDCTMASVTTDETLKFWNVFGAPQVAKPAPKANPEPFSHVNRIR